MYDYFCPACGEELKQWHESIYECPECGNMFDTDILNEEVNNDTEA
jgi:hypothetical protein